MQRSRSGETAPIRVATTGVFEFDCPSGTFELGDLVGADENAAGDALLNQQVAKVAASQYAIGRVAKRQAGGHDQRAGRHPLDRDDRRRGRQQPQRSVKTEGLETRD